MRFRYNTYSIIYLQIRILYVTTSFEINRKVPGYLDDHFAKGHGKTPAAYLTVVGIERVLPLGDEELLNTRESLWINNYDSIQFGANSRR